MEECAHPACTCRHDRDEMVKSGENLYCGERCVDQDPASRDCSCGHPECDG